MNRTQSNWVDEIDKQGQLNARPITPPTEDWASEITGQQPKSLLDPYIDKATNFIAKVPGVQQVLSTISPALDVLSRPSYAVNRFISEYQKPEANLLDSTAQAFTELFTTDPKKRYKLSYSDVIRQKDPEFAYNNPTLTQVIGFIGDVALDPTSYLGFGSVTKGFKVSSGLLNKSASTLVREYSQQIARKIFTVDDTGKIIQLIKDVPKIEKQVTKLTDQAEKFLTRIQDSQVVDEAGELIPLYRGTEDVFKKIKDKRGIQGKYYTTLPEVADIYAQETGSAVEKVYSNAKKILDLNSEASDDLLKLAEKNGLPIDPLERVDTETVVNQLRNKFQTANDIGGTEAQNKLIQQLKTAGYDAMQFISDDGGIPHQQYLIFDDKNIIPAYTNKGILAKEKLPKVQDKLSETAETLSKNGYFDAVKERQKEIIKLLDIFDPTGTKPKNLAEEEVMNELLSQAGREMSNRPLDNLWQSEVIERVTDRMNKILTLNPTIAKQVLAPKGLYLKAGLPFTEQKEIAKIFGTEYLGEKIKGLSKFIELNKDKSGLTGILSNIAFQTGRVFNRDFAIPQEIIDRRNQIENVYGSVTQSMLITARKAFQLPPEARERITKAFNWADGESRKLEEIRKLSSDPTFRTPTDGEYAQIFKQGAEQFKLNADEFNVMSRMQKDYKELALLETRVNLLKSELINYSARGYAITSDADDMSLISRGKYVQSGLPTPYLASAKQRKYLTLKEAEEAGLTPELDAAILYTHRVIQSQRALATKQFQDAIVDFYGGYKTFGETAHTGILPTAVLEEGPIPKHVIDDIRMIGQSIYPAGLNNSSRQILRLYDSLQGLWKRGATVSRPTFAIKQIISNTFQAALVMGIKAFKSFDPRAGIDAAIILARGGKPLEQLPSFLQQWFTKNTKSIPEALMAGRVVLQRHFDDVLTNDFLTKFELTTDFGDKFSGKEVETLLHENGIIRGFDATGEAFSTKLKEELSRESTSHARVAGVLAKVWNHASFIEDYSRAMLFMNGLKMGYSPVEATKLVNKALFDYQRGLSAIERNVIRRVLPFYSFQRFAIPFVLKQTLQQPGNVVTMNKLMGIMEKLLISGEELNPAEVDIFNTKGQNFLLEQPRLLAGFDKNGTATLNILNNFTPWDVLNLLTYDKEGKIDIGRTSEKTFLAALTPFLKIPLSMALDRDFFTGRTVEQSARIPGNLDNNIGQVLPQFVKDLIGFESRQHLVSGKTYTYINPFLSYYSMQFIPSLREYIKPISELEKENGSWLTYPLHYAMKLIDPVQRIEYDFKTQQQNQALTVDRDLKDIQANLVFAKYRGDGQGKETSYEFEDNWNRLQRYLLTLDERNKARQSFDVRGTGLGVVPEQGEQVQIPSTQENNFR